MKRYILQSRFTGNYFSGFLSDGGTQFSSEKSKAIVYDEKQLEKAKTVRRFERLLDGPYGCNVIEQV